MWKHGCLSQCQFTDNYNEIKCLRLNGAYPERFSLDSLLVIHRNFVSLSLSRSSTTVPACLRVCAKHVRIWMICCMKEKNVGFLHVFSVYTHTHTQRKPQAKRCMYNMSNRRGIRAAKLFSFQIDNKLLNDINGKISKPYRHYDHKNLFIVFLRVQNFTGSHSSSRSLVLQFCSVAFGWGFRLLFAFSFSLRRIEKERANEWLNENKESVQRNGNIDEWNPHPSLNLILYATS